MDWQTSYNREYFWTTGNFCGYSSLCMITLLFQRSVVDGFHQDNAKLHTATRTVETNSQFGWEELPQTLYSSDLVSLISTSLAPQRISVLNKVFNWWWNEKHLDQRLRTQPKDFFVERMQHQSSLVIISLGVPFIWPCATSKQKALSLSWRLFQPFLNNLAPL